MVEKNIDEKYLRSRMESVSKLNEAKEEINNNRQDLRTDEAEESSFVALFFSFDIVNSTKYKSLTVNWAYIMEVLLKKIKTSVERDEFLQLAYLWRVIGDEMVFMMKISNKKELRDAIDSIFSLTQEISTKLKNGKFFDQIESQKIRKMKDLEVIKIQNTLSIKSAAWITPVSINSDNSNNLDTVRSIYNMFGASDNIIGITEYQGRDMDIGFRLKSETFSKRLIISIEIAYLLKEEVFENLSKEKHKKREDYDDEINNFFEKIKIMDYKKLKGVWDNNLYPLIFYHNKTKTLDINSKNKEISFKDSFEYDESERNPLVKKYYNIIELDNFNSERESLLKKEMYDSSYAIDKIAEDINIYNKINRIASIFDENSSRNISNYKQAMELDCTVVCCDVENKRILTMKKGDGQRRNPSKLEFGCSDACSNEFIEESIKSQYKRKFNVEIDLYKAKGRTDKIPTPIFMYELETYKKGLIFVAKVKNSDKEAIERDFNASTKYVKLEWKTEEEIEKLNDDDLVTDFKHTARKVFRNMDKWFPEGEDNE